MGRAIGASAMVLGIGLFGLLAASLAPFLIEKDLEKELDPQMDRIEERLNRIGVTPRRPAAFLQRRVITQQLRSLPIT